jgi:hypothetical protein
VTIPAAAKQRTPEGAKAFAEFFYASAAKAYVSSNPTPIEALSLSSCVGCGAMIRAIGDMRNAGEHLERPSLEIKLVEVREFQPTRVEVDVAGSERAVRVLGKDGDVKRTTQAGVVTFRTQLIASPEGWRVSTMTLL